MPRNLALYLSDILKASDEILKFTSGMDRAGYENNLLVRRAVERDFAIIGDALAQMRQHHPDAVEGIEESKQIVAFRNVLVHQYADVDNDDVWSAVESKLPQFREQVNAVVKKLDKNPTV